MLSGAVVLPRKDSADDDWGPYPSYYRATVAHRVEWDMARVRAPPGANPGDRTRSTGFGGLRQAHRYPCADRFALAHTAQARHSQASQEEWYPWPCQDYRRARYQNRS